MGGNLIAITYNNLFSSSNLKDLDKFYGFRKKGAYKIYFSCNSVECDGIDRIHAWDSYPWDSEGKNSKLISMYSLNFDKKLKKYRWMIENSYIEYKYSKEELELIAEYYFELNNMENPKKIKNVNNINSIEIKKAAPTLKLLNQNKLGQLSMFDYK